MGVACSIDIATYMHATQLNIDSSRSSAVGACVLRAFSLEARRPTARATHSTWAPHPNGAMQGAAAPPMCEIGRHVVPAVRESRSTVAHMQGINKTCEDEAAPVLGSAPPPGTTIQLKSSDAVRCMPVRAAVSGCERHSCYRRSQAHTAAATS